MATAPLSGRAFGALRPLSRRRPARELCELCSAVLPPEHPHLLRLSDRHIICGCDPCAVLFGHRQDHAEYRRIPRDARALAGFTISDTEWSAMRLPIDLAFFVRDSRGERMTVFYPGPAGSTESLVDLHAWDEMVKGNAEIAAMDSDVEALLINRTRGRNDAFVAPVDHCYRLTGIIRMYWRGLSGGDEVWHEVENFFTQLGKGAGWSH